MLHLIPRFPKKIDAPTLRSRLADDGYEIDLRSVQRDLHKLSAVFPLVNDDFRPAGWSWEKGAPPFDVPGMDPHAAITFRLVEQQLAHHLPRTTLDVLKPHFKLARGVLGGLRKEGLPAWADKVRAIPRGQPLLAPNVTPSVLAAVYDALLEGKKLEVRYQNRVGKVSDGPVNPLGLVYRDALPVLVCTWFNFADDIRQLPLSRLNSASVLEEKRRVPKRFDLGTYIDSGEMSFRISNKLVKLVVRFHPRAAISVVESPLEKSQIVVEDDDGWVRIEARVADTQVLRGWLLSFGEMVEVIKPSSLRTALGKSLAAAASNYN